MWLSRILNSTFWLADENFYKIQRIWENTKYNSMYEIQEFVKC